MQISFFDSVKKTRAYRKSRAKPLPARHIFSCQRVPALPLLAFAKLNNEKNDDKYDKPDCRRNRLYFFAFFVTHRDVHFKAAGRTSSVFHQRLTTATMHLLRLRFAVIRRGALPL